MSELTREEIERIVPHEVSSGWGTSTWPLYPNHEVDKLKETALAYLDRAEEAERKHEYTLLEEAAQRKRAERAEETLVCAGEVLMAELALRRKVEAERDALKAEVERWRSSMNEKRANP